MKKEFLQKALKALKEQMKEMEGEGRKKKLPKEGMAVKVVAKDQKSLKEGLEKAKEMVSSEELKELFKKRKKA